MVLAIIVGIVVGLVALVPFLFAAKKVGKIIDPTSGTLSMLGPFLLTIVISFVILVVGLVVGKMCMPDEVMYLAGAEFAAFIVGVIAFGIWLSKRK